MKVVMEAKEMRSVLKHICQFGSRCAKSKGFDIDFEHGLYIWAGMNSWYLGCISNAGTSFADITSFVDDDGRIVNFGAMLMSYVPAIDRFEDVPNDILMKSPIGAKYVNADDKVIRLPLVDEFAYKFSDIALDLILHRMMKHGIWVEIENPNSKYVRQKLNEEDKKFSLLAKHLSSLKKTMTKDKFNAEVIKMFNDHNARHADLLDMTHPVKIPLVPKPCTDFNELNIILDCNDVW